MNASDKRRCTKDHDWDAVQCANCKHATKRRVDSYGCMVCTCGIGHGELLYM